MHHYENGVTKNRNTNNYYKPIIRMFKNIRSYLVDQNIISIKAATSYYIECLLYNVDDVLFL